jgi:A/G-specific adenine glycosylase
MAELGFHEDLPGKLLAWYDAHARRLPWRAASGIRPNPYHVWLSEIMLQQTTVAAVRAYYEKFISLWPRVEDLAAADAEDVMRAWAGLGYYARARNLHAAAQIVAGNLNGRFPESEVELRKLPGIGPYTAGAIAAIAFDRPHAAVDGNVERVLSRVFAIEAPLPASKPLIREKAQALVPLQRAGDFAQAMMDLGATICTPKSPNCLICPWMHDCEARRLGIQDRLPRKAAKKPVPVRYGIAYWVEREDGKVLLRKRRDEGLLGGMLEVPSSEWSEAPKDAPPVRARWTTLAQNIEHTFTHFHLVIEVRKAKVALASKISGDRYRWVDAGQLPTEALPTVFRKVVAAAQA